MNRLRLRLRFVAMLCLTPLSFSQAADDVSFADVTKLSEEQHRLDPTHFPTPDSLRHNVVAAHGRRPTYSLTQLISAVAVQADPHQETRPPAAATPTITPKPRPTTGWVPVLVGLAHPKLRQTYHDILPAEDPSQESIGSGTFSDLKGASFSYTWDGKSHTDTWSAQASLLFPMVWSSALEYGKVQPAWYGIIPSVSLYKVDTNGDAANKVDSLVFRSGLFAQWLLTGEPRKSFHARLNAQGSFAYATDTHGDLGLPAGEIDLEPQIFWNPRWSIGYIGELIPDSSAEPSPEGKRPMIFGYQLSLRLHGEYGTVQETSSQVRSAGDFLRIGPAAELQLQFPEFGKGLVLSSEYHYLPTISGLDGRNSLFRAGAELAILDKTAQNGPRLSLKLDYVDGGLDLTKRSG